jgi:hypothetical protein
VKYRTKLYLFFAGLVFCTTCIGLSLVYWQARQLLFMELRSKVMTIAVTMAGLIDGDAMKGVNSPADTDSETFRKIAADMKEIRDANRRDDVYVMFIYTMKPSQTDPDIFELGIDSPDEHSGIYRYTGEPYPAAKRLKLRQHLDHPWATEDVYVDQYGIFLSGSAPIVDAQGNYVATLAVDLTAGYVQKQLNRIKGIALVILIATLSVSQDAR